MFEKALELDKTNPLPLINLGLMEMQLKGNTALGIQTLKKAVAIEPKCDVVSCYQGQNYAGRSCSLVTCITY